MIEHAIAGSAPRSEGLALYGRALYMSGRHVDAERALREAVSTSPVDPEAFEFLADAAESLRHDLVARDALMNLDVLQGDLATAETRARRARRIGELSLRAGDATTAVQVLGRAARRLERGQRLLGVADQVGVDPGRVRAGHGHPAVGDLQPQGVAEALQPALAAQ